MQTDLFKQASAGVNTVSGLEDKGDQSSAALYKRVFEHPDAMIRVKVMETVRTEGGALSLDISPAHGYVHGQRVSLVKEVIADVMQAFGKAVMGTDRRTPIYCQGEQTTVEGVYNNLFTRE